MDPKYAVDLSANRYQSLDSKRVVSTGGWRGSLEQTEGKDEGRWKRERRERGSKKTEEEMEREAVCLCVYNSVCWRKDFKDPAEQKLPRFFPFFPTKAPLALDPSPLPSDYSSVSAQRQPGLLDSVGHYWHEYFCCFRDICCHCLTVLQP